MLSVALGYNMNAQVFIFSVSVVQTTIAMQVKCLYAHSLKNIMWNNFLKKKKDLKKMWKLVQIFGVPF